MDQSRLDFARRRCTETVVEKTARGRVSGACLEARRKQRIIPEIKKPANDSMDFVKTIGRLYYDKSDHKNLVKKMSAYFLDYVRSRYKLSTHTVDEDFINAVHNKTSYPVTEIRSIVRFIQFADTAPAISESQLSEFHTQLELFYQNT